ncbi:hypothetical protein FOCG_18278 [Fusarium oxysporum f. sp. radicis-lycopersici 26381]|nr:hypothetical protein FOCG_18278 [Fusarium oxysporum f. sp. radicis-lycopersici 26381]
MNESRPTSVFQRARRRPSFVGCCDKNLWAMLPRTASSAPVSRPSSNNKAITSLWASTGPRGSSNVTQNYLPSLENVRKPPDLTGLLRRRSIGTSISGRTSTAGSSLRTRLTWTRAV